MFNSYDRKVLYEILSMVRTILQTETREMATLQDVMNKIQELDTVEDSVLALVASIAQQLKDAKASNDPAALDAVISSLEAEKQKLADAVAANTPAEA